MNGETPIQLAHRKLYVSMVLRAIRDAAGLDIPYRAGSESYNNLRLEAAEWLMDTVGLEMVERIGIDRNTVTEWVNSGCNISESMVNKYIRKQRSRQ